MTLQFVREIPIRIVIEASSARRGFLFHVAAGFFKDIEPLSGMSADLMLVDQWLMGLKKDLEQTLFITSSESFNHSFAEILAVTRLNLMEEAEREGTLLKSLLFREERGWSFSWDSSLPAGALIVSHSLYLESFARSAAANDVEAFDLLKVTFNWSRKQGCEADFSHETLKLLKACQRHGSDKLHQKLQAVLGTTLPSGSFVKSIEINYLGEKYSLIFKVQVVPVGGKGF